MLPRYQHKLTEIQEMVLGLLQTIISASELTLKGYEEVGYFEQARTTLKNLESDTTRIDNEVIKTFALFGPEADELRLLIAYLKMTNELERIGEGLRKYARRFEDHISGSCDLSALMGTITQLHKTTIHALGYLRDSLIGSDAEDIQRKVLVEESKNDDLFSIMEKEILTSIVESKELSVEYVTILGTLRKLERIGDRAVHIASLLVYAQKGGRLYLYTQE